MISRDSMLDLLLEKIQPAAERVSDGIGDDHDLFPSLLWLILKGETALQERITDFDRIRASDRDALKALIAQLDKNQIKQLADLDGMRKADRDDLRAALEAAILAASTENKATAVQLADGVSSVASVVNGLKQTQAVHLSDMNAARVDDRAVLRSEFKAGVEELLTESNNAAARLEEIAGNLAAAIDRLKERDAANLRDLGNARSADREALTVFLNATKDELASTNAVSVTRLLDVGQTLGNMNSMNQRLRVITWLVAGGLLLGLASVLLHFIPLFG